MLSYARRRTRLALVRESRPVGPRGPGWDRYSDGASAWSTVHPNVHPVVHPVEREDPFENADALDELAHEIATLAAHIHAATQRLLELIGEFDRRQGWELGGHRSCAHWLAFRTGIDLGTAREKVRAARALEDLPETSASMARGELSFSAVRALTRVATPENEADLLELARGCTTAQIERTVRSWKRGTRMEEVELDRERHESRCLSVFPDGDGMYVVKGRLPAEIGALLMRALEASSDALYRERVVVGGDGAPDSPGAEESEPDTVREAAQRRADAIGLLAERALASGLPGADADTPAVSGTRAERYQVLLHVERETLTAGGGSGRSELEDGTRVSPETSRRLSCDAGIVRITHEAGGSVMNAGRRTRTIPLALRRALDARDRGCRFPTTRLRRAVPAVSASPTRTTSGIGPTEARPRLETAFFFAGTITDWYTKEDGAWSGGGRPIRPSSIHEEGLTSTAVGSLRSCPSDR